MDSVVAPRHVFGQRDREDHVSEEGRLADCPVAHEAHAGWMHVAQQGLGHQVVVRRRTVGAVSTDGPRRQLQISYGWCPRRASRELIIA